LLHEYLLTETSNCIAEGVRLSIIGRRDRMPATLARPLPIPRRLLRMEHVYICVWRSITRRAKPFFHAACRFYKVTKLSPESFSDVLSEVLRGGSTDVDLLIRTGGEQRLSDFLLWECAFAEFVFTDKRWPDFTPDDLEAALREFDHRERTRGALPDAIAG